MSSDRLNLLMALVTYLYSAPARKWRLHCDLLELVTYVVRGYRRFGATYLNVNAQGLRIANQPNEKPNNHFHVPLIGT